jgi:iron complex outermembrane receptor protein
MNYDMTYNLKFTSTTGYYNYKENGWGTFDFTALAMASGSNNDGQRSLSEELRLQSSYSGPLNYTLGFFYGDDKRSWIENGAIGYLGVDPATGRTDNTATANFYTGETYSGFAQLNWGFAPGFELSGGARYTSEHKTGDLGNTYLIASLANSYLPVGERLVGGFTETNVSPEVTLAWHPAHDVMIYGAFKTGFKSGGFSSPTREPANATLENQKFNEETVRGEEFGIKFSTMSHRLNGDLTAYDYLYKGLQLTAYDAADSSYFTQHAGSARIIGTEFNLTYQLTEKLTLHESVAYNHARYVSFPNSQCYTGQTAAEGCIGGVRSLDDAPLSEAPDWSAQVGATYDVPINSDWTLGLHGDVHYSAGYYVEANDNPYAWQSSYFLFNAGAHLYNIGWDLAVVGRNKTNTIYGVAGSDKPLGPVGQVDGWIGQPLEVLVQFTRHF